MPIPPAVRTSSGAVIVPLVWSGPPPLSPRLALPEVILVPKEELHLTLLSSAEASAIDESKGSPAAWSELVEKFGRGAHRLEFTGSWWLLRSGKPEGPAWSVVARVRCPAFEAFRRRASAASSGAVSASAPAHVTLFVAGDARGIGLPTRQRFRTTRLRRLDKGERLKALHAPQGLGSSD
jgi:hypothetical protein